jgi:hypothetical protein
MNETEMIECLECIVWGERADPYAAARSVMGNRWWRSQTIYVLINEWAKARSDEHYAKCSAIEKKCDLKDEGVRVIYDHYKRIQDRYWRVHVAALFL